MTATALMAPRERLIRLSRTMAWVTTLGIALVIILAAIGVATPSLLRNIALAKLGQAGAALPITPLGQCLAGIALAIPIGVMVHGLLAVRRMFRTFARGEIFGSDTVRHLRVFAATVFLQGPLGPLTAAMLSAALSAGNPPGERAIMIAFSINDYFALIVGGALFAAATIMREASRLADENAAFV